MSFASYKWASSLMWFSPIAPASKKTALDIIANLSADAAPWNTDIEFRTAVSFSHELVHYYQDTLTGAGCWDHIKYRHFLAESFMWANQLLSVSRQFPFTTNGANYQFDPYYKYCYDEYAKLAGTYAGEFIYAKNEFIDKNARRKELNTYLQKIFQEKMTVPDDNEEFLTESLFESEAVATVFQTFINLPMSDEQYDTFMRNDFLIMPHKMEGIYTATISFMMGFVNDVIPNATDEQLMTVTMNYVRFLVDLSCACPDPGMIEKTGLNKFEFEPGVKFLRLVFAIHTIDGPGSQAFLEAFKEKDAHKAEQVLLDNCEVKYPHSKDIYASWGKLFEEMLKKEDDILLELRLNCCNNRVKNTDSSFTMKNLTQLLFHNLNIPVNFLTAPEGITSYFMNLQIDKEFQGKLLIDLMKWNTDMELFRLFFVSGKFSCPLAEANVCDIATAKCKDIHSLEEIPNSRECLVRRRATPFF